MNSLLCLTGGESVVDSIEAYFMDNWRGSIKYAWIALKHKI